MITTGFYRYSTATKMKQYAVIFLLIFFGILILDFTLFIRASIGITSGSSVKNIIFIYLRNSPSGGVLLSILIPLASFVLLTRGIKFSSAETQREEQTIAVQRQIKALSELNARQIQGLQNELDTVKEIEGFKANERDFDELKKELIDSISVGDILASNKTDLLKALALDRVQDEFRDVKNNLADYNHSLRSQYSTTLYFGAFLGLVPIGIAFYLINRGVNGNYIDNEGHIMWPNLIGFYVPWITIIVVIEFLAAFFLKLYRNTIEMDRHLRNEITTVGMTIAGVEMALMHGDPKQAKETAKYLLNAERHQVISKDQTTIEIEKARFDHEAFKESANFFRGLVPNLDPIIKTASNDTKNPSSD